MNIVRESWSGKKMRFHAFFKRKRVNIDLRKFAPSTYSNRDQNVARVTLQYRSKGLQHLHARKMRVVCV